MIKSEVHLATEVLVDFLCPKRMASRAKCASCLFYKDTCVVRRMHWTLCHLNILE